LKGKYYEEFTAQHKKGDAGIPDGTMNCTAFAMSRTLWMISNSED
jgi:hypothetical protein